MQSRYPEVGSATSLRCFRRLAVGLLLGLVFAAPSVHAREWQVPPGKGTLQRAIDTASDGDTLSLGTSTYSGSIDVKRSLTLVGNPEGASLIDGEGSAHVILVSAPDVVIRGLDIRNSGDVAEDEDSGIFITDKGDRALIHGNHLQGNLIGTAADGTVGTAHV